AGLLTGLGLTATGLLLQRRSHCDDYGTTVEGGGSTSSSLWGLDSGIIRVENGWSTGKDDVRPLQRNRYNNSTLLLWTRCEGTLFTIVGLITMSSSSDNNYTSSYIRFVTNQRQFQYKSRNLR
ncbi:hypothetical protein HAX54_042785, partial [Datura stramonium]|nr:hypothetical protein [Datura stramonium]